MLIRLFREATADERVQLSALLQLSREERTATQVAWMRKLIDTYDCIEYARQIAHGLAGAALHEFTLVYAGLPDSRDKQFIEGLATWIFERT
jgi:geranylgeranyl diphosphate synthase, type II